MTLPLRAGDRVGVRSRPWRVGGVEEVGPGQHLLRLIPAAGDGGSPLAVVAPPERIVPLPAEELRFDPAELGPLGPWLAAHRALIVDEARALADSGSPRGPYRMLQKGDGASAWSGVMATQQVSE